VKTETKTMATSRGTPADPDPDDPAEPEPEARPEPETKLFDADPNCKHEIVALWSGIKCSKCPGWFCY
jgi:hypothetical protein